MADLDSGFEYNVLNILSGYGEVWSFPQVLEAKGSSGVISQGVAQR